MRIAAFVLMAFVAIISQRALAQTVQLPTYSFTTVGTSVMVPDRGATFLGGIDRAASGRNEFGVPGLAFPGLQSRSFGQDLSSSSMWATVTIHDFDAMDQAILNSPSPGDFAGLSASGGRSNWNISVPRGVPALQLDPVNLTGHWHEESPPHNGDKVAAAEADRESRRTARSAEAEGYFARGQQAEADGKLSAAKIYYQMAARRASGEFKQQVEARLDTVSGHTTAVAKNSP